MPTPRTGETQGDFVTRCIPVVLDDGTAKDAKQATAICFSMWEQAKKESRASGQVDLRDGLSDPDRIERLQDGSDD